MRKRWDLIISLSCILNLAVYSQSKITTEQEPYSGQKWGQLLNSNIPNTIIGEYYSKESDDSFHSGNDTRSRFAFSHFNAQLSKKNEYQKQYSDWQKLEGPYGGSVRRFYLLGNNLYALTDREVFVYKNGAWNSLNFESISCNMVRCIYQLQTGKLLVGCDWGLYLSTDDQEKWKSISVGSWENGVNDIYDTGNGKLLLSTNKGIYISGANNVLDFKLLTLDNTVVETVSFDPSGNMWAGTSTSVLKAKYGEFNWQKMKLAENYYKKVVFDKNNTIYTFSGQQVLKSSDQGKTWLALSGSYYTDIDLDPKENLIITSIYHIALADTNGIQWVSKKSDRFLLTTFYSSEDELLVGILGAGARKYDRNTNVFSNFSEGLNVSTFRGLIPMANGEILACTDSDSLYVSNDNGLTWKSIYSCWSRCLKSSKEGSVYVGANGGIIMSKDFGRNWTRLNIDVSPYYINAIDIGDDSKIVCAGSSTGEVYLSYDAGEHFKQIRKSDYNFVDAIKIINERTLLIEAGMVYYTNDDGNNYEVVGDSLMFRVNDITIDNLGYLYLASFGGLYKSLDGINWSRIPNNYIGALYLRQDPFGNIYAAGGDGAVYCSTDHGKNWQMKAPSIPNTFFWSFALTSDGYLFCGSQDKGLYRTKVDIQKPFISNVSITRNFPNPFNNSTRIEYKVPNYAFVEMKIYNLLGQEVQTLVSEYKDSGEYYVTWQPTDCSSGVYFCRVTVGSKTEINKMLFLK